MKVDPGRRYLILAPGESSFPGPGWVRGSDSGTGVQVGEWREWAGQKWRKRVMDTVLSGMEKRTPTCHMSMYSSYKSS